MKSRLITNLLLAALLITLGLVAWLTSGQENEEQTRVTSLDISAIDSIVIEHRNSENISLNLINQKWKITKPFNAPALSGKIAHLLKISQIAPPVIYPLVPSLLTQFGLAKPVARISFNGETLSIGGIETINSRRYVTSNEQLFLLDDTFLHHLTAQPNAYIDTRLLPDNTQIVELQTPQIHLKRNQENIWATVSQTPLELSSDAVQMLLDEWRFARAIHVNYQPKQDTGQVVTITLANNQKINFKFIQQKDDAILMSPGSQLAYTFSREKYKKMNTLPKLDNSDA